MKSLLIAFSALALLASSAHSAFAENNQITLGTVTVAAVNDEWTATSIKVAPNDILLTVEKGGQIVMGTFAGSTGADGLSNGIGALQLKIGSGAAQTVGAKGFVIVKETGSVKLKVFDTKYQDNSGEYKVMVLHIPSSLIPTSKDVSTEK
jgi:hypothetical protein